MSLPVYIIDEEKSISSEINEYDNHRGLVTATYPLTRYENKQVFFQNNTYGIDMNVAVIPSGSPEKVHNGTDDALWTFSNIIGTIATANSTDFAHTGTKSVKWINGNINDTIQFLKSSPLTVSNYSSITIWIYVTSEWQIGDHIEIYGWNTSTSTINGISVQLNNYFNWGVYNTWHKLTIPVSDMKLINTLNVIRCRVVTKQVRSPVFYMDDIQFELVTNNSTPVIFKVEPEIGKWLYVHELTVTVVDTYDPTLANTSMIKIPYNSFFSIPKLDSGITYKRTQNNKVTFSTQIKQMIDILQLSGSTISGNGSDGTNTWIVLKNIMMEPLLLKYEDNDSLSMTVNDNLSDLLLFRIGAGCKEETR